METGNSRLEFGQRDRTNSAGSQFPFSDFQFPIPIFPLSKDCVPRCSIAVLTTHACGRNEHVLRLLLGRRLIPGWNNACGRRDLVRRRDIDEARVKQGEIDRGLAVIGLPVEYFADHIVQPQPSGIEIQDIRVAQPNVIAQLHGQSSELRREFISGRAEGVTAKDAIGE